MRLKKKLVFLAAGIMSAAGTMYAQSAIDRLQPLVEVSAQRLAIAEQVAFAKWDSRTPVEDTSREAQIMVNAVDEGKGRGLDQDSIASFFKAQIEANKLVQYSLLAEWHRVGKAPDHTPVNLAKTIRPKLDQVETQLIAELAATVSLRASPSCQADIARAVGKYISTHENDLTPLKGIALDRALAGACTS